MTLAGFEVAEAAPSVARELGGDAPAKAATATARAAAALPPLERLWGWGRSSSALSHVVRPSTRDGLEAALDLARRTGLRVGLRGAGQSYGDAALASGGMILDGSRLARILDWDPDRGIARVEPGVTIATLWRHAIEDGWWPAVVPGTSLATVGGCAAANAHGKNNWKAGSFGEHVDGFELLLPSGDVVVCSRTQNPELFHGAIGGFGMLGCFSSVTLRLKRIHSPVLDVVPIAARNLREMLDAFASRLESADYLVGWLDAFARGDRLGRGLVHAASHREPGGPAPDRAAFRSDLQDLPDTLLHAFPKSEAWRVLRVLFNPPAMRAVNSVKYMLGRREAGRGYAQPHAQFAFLLDFFPDWRRAYGPDGMIQYQSFVPEADAERVFRAQIELAQRQGLVPLLGVVKRHRLDPFPMTHAVDGYSLALEFKIPRGRRADLWRLARAMDPLVLDAGGRFYFAKDATLSHESLERWLAEERVQRFLALKARVDPEGLLETDLYRRIFRPWSD
ncbi:MAG TPA: FAD-binding oxidoreductase [Candidatus Binatia bacterium]|nr:FAD-binding oxidoreductase [Candidatus Binatia bacterium]